MTISVAVVDDQALVRRGFALVLDHQPDIEVVAEAGNGLEAIGAVCTHRPDVVLMDIRMPEMDGLAATAAILEAADWPLKVIILYHLRPRRGWLTVPSKPARAASSSRTSRPRTSRPCCAHRRRRAAALLGPAGHPPPHRRASPQPPCDSTTKPAADDVGCPHRPRSAKSSPSSPRPDQPTSEIAEHAATSEPCRSIKSARLQHPHQARPPGPAPKPSSFAYESGLVTPGQPATSDTSRVLKFG